MEEPRDIFQTCVDAAAAAGLDFLLASRDLRRWSEILTDAGYGLVAPERPIVAFAQFQPREGEGFRIDLMLVNDVTFAKLLAGSEWLNYGQRRVRVVGVLHLIALKLHALREEHRIQLGKDYLDILNLIRRNALDFHSPAFQEILKSHGSDAVREQLRRDVG